MEQFVQQKKDLSFISEPPADNSFSRVAGLNASSSDPHFVKQEEAECNPLSQGSSASL
jgi:hypothetical protein